MRIVDINKGKPITKNFFWAHKLRTYLDVKIVDNSVTSKTPRVFKHIKRKQYGNIRQY